MLRILAWSALIMQILVGVAIVRHKAPSSLIVVLNLVAASLVLGYWGRRWFGYLFRGISWSATDQLIPAYALLVCLLALLTLSGRYRGVGVHFWIFGVHTLILLAAALFFSFFRMTRLL